MEYAFTFKIQLYSQYHSLSHSARNLTFIFDEHLTFSDQISALSKSCYFHIRELRCILPYLDFKTANTIATSIVHCKLDCCNSLYYSLPYSQLNRLQQIQNCLARAVFKAPKFTHTTPILKSLHWLKINQRIEYKILSLTYEVLTTAQPFYLRNFIDLCWLTSYWNSFFFFCYPLSTIIIFLFKNHWPLISLCISLPLE